MRKCSDYAHCCRLSFYVSTFLSIFETKGVRFHVRASTFECPYLQLFVALCYSGFTLGLEGAYRNERVTVQAGREGRPYILRLFRRRRRHAGLDITPFYEASVK